MKSHELYSLVHEFDKMWKDERFNLDIKINMAKEMISSLPPISLLRNCNSTYMAVTELISQTVNGAVNARNAETTRSDQPKNGAVQSTTNKVPGVDGGQHAPPPNKANEVGGRTKMGKTPKTPSGNKKRSTNRSH